MPATQAYRELADQVSNATADAIAIGIEQILASPTAAPESAKPNLPVRKDLQAVAPQESSKPIELQLFRGMGLCLRDAIALDLMMCPDMEELMARLDRHIHGGVIAPLSGFAMVIFAIEAKRARGFDDRSAVWAHLLGHTIAKLPAELKPEALLVLRCMLARESDNPTARDCAKRFVEHCASLAPQAEGELLQKLCKMQWWHPAICNFAGHIAPVAMKLIAAQNMLAMVAPRLPGKSALTHRRCMTYLMENIFPVLAETPKDGPLDREPWKSSVNAWSETAIKLEPVNLEWVMSDLQTSIAYEPSALWPHQTAIFLDVVARLEFLRKEAQRPALRDMQPWLDNAFMEACRRMGSEPRLAGSLCMQMLRIVAPMNEPWAKSMHEKLRDAINGKPVVHEAQPSPVFSPDSCKTQ